MMAILPATRGLATHRVTNQPLPVGDRDLWSDDPALREAVARGRGDLSHVGGHGRRLGTEDCRMAARDANRYPPALDVFDQAGARRDAVTFHPTYHEFLAMGLGAGYSGVAWEGGQGGHVTHAAMVYLHSQVEPGTCCPMTMTYASVPVLANDPVLAGLWVPRLTARAYDPCQQAIETKGSATLGMAMTEKQGGSDLRATATRAELTGDGWRLTGHKWFCSAPMSDGFLTLAQTPKGLSCFLVPRWLAGERNAIRLMRLKDKLGNRSNASAEIEYEGALAFPIGEQGRGIATILSMVHHTRLDTAMAPAGLMRAALAEALHWTANRSAFGRRLIDQPLMRSVLADLALDWEAAVALGLRMAQAFDGQTETERALARVGVALAKFLNNKRCIPVVAECMEVLGGMGYVEDTPLPMLYREAPLNGIWEGSGNVICLDILRTLAKEPLAGAALQQELSAATGVDHRYDAALGATRDRWPGLPDEAEARAFAERLGHLLAASLLIRHGTAAVADAYVATRLETTASVAGSATGLARNLDVDAILSRLGAA